MVGWLSVWVPSPGWLCRILELCDVCQALRCSRRAWGRGVRAVPRLCIEYPGICLTTEENHGNHSQGNGMALDCSAPNAIRFVDLAIAGEFLDWLAVPCRPWLPRQATGSTLGQRKYLPSCRTRGFPTSANFESQLSVGALVWSANSGTPKSSCVCLLRTKGHQQRGEDTWIVTPVTSGHGSGQRTSTRGTHSPSGAG